MLQLIIAVLISMGFSYDQGKIVGASESDKQRIIENVKSSAEYQDLGGDDAFNSVVVVPDVDPAQ
jgi:hypothetical protein